MKLKTLFLAALLSGCSTLPRPPENVVDTYNLAYGRSDGIGTLYIHKDTGDDNCIAILAINDSTVANMLSQKVIAFNLDYGVYLIGASYRGDFCGTRDSLLTVTMGEDSPIHLSLTTEDNNLLLSTRTLDQK